MSDVTLVIEGGYPFATGGVSEWTNGLVHGLPQLKFAVAALREPGAPRRMPAYALPPNVTSVAEVGSPDELPRASVYHALSTGAAGAFAAKAAAERGSRFVLSEHGLAWLEARLGIVACKPHGAVRTSELVDAEAREAYARAHAVTAVCEWNARLQRRASGRAVRLVENAVPLVENAAREIGPPLVGFVGRVAPVKDVATFVRACRLVADELADVRFVVVGPLDHAPAYVARCRELAAGLGLEIEFAGETDPAPWYARMDVLVLTSRSEAQPLVALEAMAAGVPVVASDVGGCRELLAGAGLVTSPGQPVATAAAVLRLLGDDALRARLAAAARTRIETRHDPRRMLRAFHELYEAAAA
jgi:glycosyltransferase involved in cell wall biosynthesis